MNARKIYIIDEINDELYAKFTKQLDDLLQKSNTKPIELEICSQGGSPYTALAMYARIRSCPVKVHGHAVGACMSAATLVLAACDTRSAHSTTWFMVHESLDELKGMPEELLAKAEQAIAEEYQWNVCLSKRTGTSNATWEKFSKQTRFLSAADALGLKLIQKITKDKK